MDPILSQNEKAVASTVAVRSLASARLVICDSLYSNVGWKVNYFLKLSMIKIYSNFQLLKTFFNSFVHFFS